MKAHTIHERIRYAETDQMGFCHHSRYAVFFEMGRTEWLRKAGIAYKTLEQSGILLPVVHMETKFYHPARYDDPISITTWPASIGAASVVFETDIYISENSKKITSGKIKLASVNAETGKPSPMPKEITEIIKKALL